MPRVKKPTPVVELVWWSSTDEFLADVDTLFKPTVDHVSAAPGCLKTYYGVEVEDSTNFWMVVVWQSHAHHKAMMDRPDYADMVARIKPFLRTGQLFMRHVQFGSADFDIRRVTALDAPVTALLFAVPKPKEEVEAAGVTDPTGGRWESGKGVQAHGRLGVQFGLMSWGIGALDTRAPGEMTRWPPATWSQAEEDENETIIAFGRGRVEDQELGDGGASSPWAKALSQLEKIANVKAVHIRLKPGRA